jgi:hypothetical protein
MGWIGYWKYFFSALMRLKGDHKEIRAMLHTQRDWMRSQNILSFDVQWSVGLALFETLEGNLEKAQDELSDIGVPNEKYWQFAGPFDALNRSIFEENQQEGILTASDEVIPEGLLKNGFDGIPDAYINFSEIMATERPFTGYAYLTLNSTTVQPALIRLGNSRPIKVWVNGELLFTLNSNENARLDSDVLWTRLRAGNNRIVIKMSSRGGEAGFYFRLTNKKGYGLQGVTFGAPTLI